jgi:methionyl-tRNA synthetase
VSDIDLSLTDFVARVNSDVLGKIANLGFRVGSMLNRHYDSMSGTFPLDSKEFLDTFRTSSALIGEHYEKLEFSRAMREICRLADIGNKYLEDKAPWTTIKTDKEGTLQTLTAALEAFRLITLFIKPVMPAFVARVETLLSLDPMQWSSIDSPIENHRIEKFEHLAIRIEKENMDMIIEESKPEASAPAVVTLDEPLVSECTIEDFQKVDLRVAEIKKAEHVEGADQLLRLVVDIGGIERTLFAGIKAAYKPEDLVGAYVVVVANLKPRKMRFGTSEAMVLASGKGGKDIFVLRPDKGAAPGQRIH